MDYQKSEHLELLKRSLELEKLNKSLFTEEPENFRKLMKHQSIVSDHIFWTKRKDFLLLIRNFIADTIDYEEFETSFFRLFKETRLEVSTLTKDVGYIENFDYNSVSNEFGSWMWAIYRSFEEVDDEVSTEQEVKDYVSKVFLLLQNFKFEF